MIDDIEVLRVKIGLFRVYENYWLRFVCGKVRCPRVMIDNNGMQTMSHARFALGERARRAAS